MRLRFIGGYTGGRTSITMGEYTFEGHEPLEVDTSTDMGRRLSGNPDFEVVDALDHDGDGKKGGSVPDSPPALTGKNKAALLEIAKAEGAAANEEMTNADIRAAIEDNRQ